MARIILYCNGVRISSIADLYDNFNFEDLKFSLTSGKLQYWLTTNGFSVECEAVEKIDCNAIDADIQIMRALKYPDEKQNAYLEAKRLQAEKKALEEAKRLQAEKAEAEKKALEEKEDITDLDTPLQYLLEEIEKIIRSSLPQNHLPPTPFHSAMSLSDDLHFDGFKICFIAKKIGECFDFVVSFDDSKQMKTIGDIVTFAMAHNKKQNAYLEAKRLQLLEEIEKIIRSSLPQNHLPPTPFHSAMSLSDDLHFDGFKICFIAKKIGERFGFVVSFNDSKQMKTIGDIVTFVIIKHNKKQNA